MRRNWISGAVLCAAMLVPVTANAGGELFCVRESDNVLRKIDLDSLTFTDIGPLGISFDFGGMAYDGNSGTLYMIGGRPSQALYEVDMNTGAASLIGNHGISDMFGLAFDTSTNTLFGITFTGGGDLYKLDTSNGNASYVGTGTTRIGGLAYDSQADRLIGVNDGGGDLYEIDRSNGNQTLLYEGPYTNNSGLAYDSERNYLWDIDWNGNLIYFDIDNGYLRTDVLTGLGSHDGLAFVGGPANCLDMTVSTLTAGQTATWDIARATPGAKGVVVYGFQPGTTVVNGQFGYCATFGIKGVNQSKAVGFWTADGNGDAQVRKRLPNNARGLRVLTQAAEQGTCPDECVSNLDDQVVQ